MKKEFKLVKIELYNVFNYRKTHTIDFTTDKRNGNIFLFDIKNGGGKTSLFLAIKWGFYGTDSGIKYEKDGLILNNKDFMNQDEYDDGSFHVKICFEYDGTYMELRRECTDYRVEKTKLTLKIDNYIISGEEAKEKVSSIIPPNYGDFFMFNGEILQEIANSQKDYQKTDNVYRLLGLSQLRDLRDILVSIQKQQNEEFSRIGNASKDLSILNGELKRLNEKLDRLKKKESEYSEQLEDVSKEISELEGRRQLYSNLESTVESINKLNNQLKIAENQKSELINMINADSKNAFLLFCKDDINDLISRLKDEKHQLKTNTGGNIIVNGEYLHIQERIYEEHLENCPVCMSEISKEIREMIRLLRKENSEKGEKYREYQTELGMVDEKINLLSNVVKKTPNNLNSFCNELFDLIEKIEGIRNQIYNLNNVLTESDIDAIRGISEQLTELYKLRSSLNEDSFNNSNLMRNTEKAITSTRRKISDKMPVDSEHSKLSNRVRYVDKLVTSIDKIISIVSKKKRGDILDRANDVFMSITNKHDTYRGLSYDDEKSFSMHIVRKDGAWIMHPSSGEKHVLAISFLVSLSLNTERLTPMMMDTPLSRLDNVHKRNIGKTLEKLDNQILFLAQPGELDDFTRESFRSNVAKTFVSVPTEDNTACIREVTDELQGI